MNKSTQTKFIVVAGGVISGVGKGVTTASLGKILKEHGYKTTLIKVDPYINYDAGTLRPTEHGEVWVTADGGEIDQDLGTYERFINEDIPRKNNITTGQVYQAVLDRERKGEYLGQTVQFIPHIIDEVNHRIKQAAEGYDIAIIEIGGTVGDYENVPFLFALKTLQRELGPHGMAHILVTYLPVPHHIGEMKTKPTQQAIRLLGQEGILPDFIICRSHYPIDEIRRKKIEIFSHVAPENIISASDVETVYQQPLDLEGQKLGEKILKTLGLESKRKPDWSAWQERVSCLRAPKRRVAIAIVGKYLDVGAYSLTDSYISICHALMHAGAELHTAVDITWIDAKRYEQEPHTIEQLSRFDGVIVPGGFGNTGIEGKIATIKYVREQGIPYVGLCYGLQLAVVEFARNVCGWKDAHTTEVDKTTTYPVIDLLPMQKQYLKDQCYGGSMRLGAYDALLKSGTHVFDLYENACRLQRSKDGFFVTERHRHRYEVNPAYVHKLEQKGLLFSGYHRRADDTLLMEFAELSDHPFFIATQAHPEFTSRFTNPNPIFHGFVVACQQQAVMRSKKDTHVRPEHIVNSNYTELQI
jgi:CTP synthase